MGAAAERDVVELSGIGLGGIALGWVLIEVILEDPMLGVGAAVGL